MSLFTDHPVAIVAPLDEDHGELGRIGLAQVEHHHPVAGLEDVQGQQLAGSRTLPRGNTGNLPGAHRRTSSHAGTGGAGPASATGGAVGWSSRAASSRDWEADVLSVHPAVARVLHDLEVEHRTGRVASHPDSDVTSLRVPVLAGSRWAHSSPGAAATCPAGPARRGRRRLGRWARRLAQHRGGRGRR